MRYLCLCCCMCTCTDKLLFKERTTWQLAFTFGPSSAAHLLASTAERQRRGLARTRSLLSGMCSSTQTNLAHWLCQTQRERQDINPLFWRTSSLDYLPVVWHNSCLLQSIMRVFTWADQKISSLFFCCCWWKKIVWLHSTTSMPNSAMMSKNGMVTKIHTRIRADPFTANYELVGKELGRWVLFVAWMLFQQSLMEI